MPSRFCRGPSPRPKLWLASTWDSTPSSSSGTFGGAATIASLEGPFPHLRFVPTGGVKPHNLADFLSRANIPAVGGTWLTPADAVAARDCHTIANLVREAVDSAHHIVKEQS